MKMSFFKHSGLAVLFLFLASVVAQHTLAQTPANYVVFGVTTANSLVRFNDRTARDDP